MKKVMLLLLLLLAACETPQERPIDPETIIQDATAEAIQASLHDDVQTFSLVWNKGGSQLIVTETSISLIPNDVPKIPLLSEDADMLKVFLKENRYGLLNETSFSENRLPECRDGSLRITINGIGKTVPVAGCATLSLTYKALFEKLRELEDRYYP